MIRIKSNRESQQEGQAARATDIAVLLLPVAVFAIPAASNTFAESRFVSLTMILATILVALLAAASVAAGLRRTLRLSPALLVAFGLPAVMWVSLAAAPSGAGLILTIFATGAAGLTMAMTLLDEHGFQTRVAIPLLLTSAVQGLLVIVQTITDQPVGLNLLNPDAELRVIDGLLRSQGMMHHVYETTALALGAAGVGIITASRVTGRRRWLWIATVGIAGTTVGLTHSRSALVSVILIVPFLAVAWRRDRAIRTVAAAFLIGFLAAAVLTSSAWLLRGDHSVSGDIDDMSLGRITLIQQAVTMTADHPLLGVGPGNYLDVMRAEYELDPDYPFIVHNFNLAIAAENGVLAALAITVLLGWAIVRGLREGLAPAALTLSIVGFLVFDVIHYNRPLGLLLLAIWLGTLHITDEKIEARSNPG